MHCHHRYINLAIVWMNEWMFGYMSVTHFPPIISPQILHQYTWNFQARPTFTQLTIWKPYQPSIPFPTLPYHISSFPLQYSLILTNVLYNNYHTLPYYLTLPYPAATKVYNRNIEISASPWFKPFINYRFFPLILG